jgi:hypothetical protein
MELLIFVRIETTKVYMNDREKIDMTKKLPRGHNLGGSTKQKRRKEHKQEK